MAEFSLAYFVFLLIILLINPLNHSSSTESVASQATNVTQQIQNICSKTLEPYECFQCIIVDPSRDPDDTPELIHALSLCLYSQANAAHINADLLSQNTSVPSLKTTLSQCSSLLFNAANFAIDAMMNMESKKYAKAWESSKSARRLGIRCVRLFLADGNLTIPYPVLGHMIHAKRLYDSMHVLFPLIVN